MDKDIFINFFVRPRAKLWAWRGDRVVDGARLESECAPQGYRGFESLPLRKTQVNEAKF